MYYFCMGCKYFYFIYTIVSGLINNKPKKKIKKKSAFHTEFTSDNYNKIIDQNRKYNQWPIA